jgi:tRNA nucleotidyltransferase (CCA-adding enzyme)
MIKKAVSDIQWMNQHAAWGLVLDAVKRLTGSGFQAVLAGGCVRDEILGRIPKDLDLATNATPEQIESLFPRHVSVGKSFGVIRVLADVSQKSADEPEQDIEIASFRNDGLYVDGRRPLSVTLKSSPQEDAARRDFTVNALFWNPSTGEILDFIDGLKDLRGKVLRTVGEPERRFAEDFLRVLRLFRFSCELGFSIEQKTLAAALGHAGQLKLISRERIRDELEKMLRCSDGRGLPVEFESQVLSVILGRETHIQFALGQTLNQRFDELGLTLDQSGLEVSQSWWVWLKILSWSDEQSLERIQDLRLSKSELKAISRAFGILNAPKKFAGLSLGQQREQLQFSEVRIALCLMNETWSDELLRWWVKVNQSMPSPLKSAADFPELEGLALGQAIKNAFWQQLEKL